MSHVDLAFWMYAAGVAVSLYGFGLFLWWWKKVGSATDVYVFIAILFIANAFSDAVAGYARLMKDINPKQYFYFMDCGVWAWRRVPELIILILLVGRMTQRIVRAKGREAAGEVLIGQQHHNMNRAEKEEKGEGEQ